MLRRIALLALLVGSLALAKTYNFKITDPTEAGKTLLKPGDYSLKLERSQVVLMDKSGHHIDTTATVESASQKFDETAVATSKTSDGYRLDYIQLGGSRSKVVFR